MTVQSGAEHVIRSLDVAHLNHAYGPADDTDKLLGLLGDEEEMAAASSYLYSAILHQGTPWLATVPITDVLAELVDYQQAKAALPLLVTFVGDVAEVPERSLGDESIDEVLAEAAAAAGPDALDRALQLVSAGHLEELFSDDVLTEYLWLYVLDQIVAHRKGWHEHLARLITAADLDIERAEFLIPALLTTNGAPGDPTDYADISAWRAAAKPFGLPDAERDPLIAELQVAAAPEADARWRPAAVFRLGQLGADVTAYRGDTDFVVRVAASWFAHLRQDAQAAGVFRELLCDPKRFETLLSDVEVPWGYSPFAPCGYFRFAARYAAVAPRSEVFAPALAAARFYADAPGDLTWGIYLPYLLGESVSVAELDSAQREFLTQLCDIEGIWDPSSGNNSAVWKAIGLPYDRETIRQVAVQ